MGINSALPPLAEDVYVLISHANGTYIERFIVRMGIIANNAHHEKNKDTDEYTENLGFFVLSFPPGAILPLTSLEFILRHC